MVQALGFGGWMFDGITALGGLRGSGDPALPGRNSQPGRRDDLSGASESRRRRQDGGGR